MSAQPFADAVEAFSQAAYDVALDGMFVMPAAKREYQDARAALLAAHEAAIADAEARCRAEVIAMVACAEAEIRDAALAEVDAAIAAVGFEHGFNVTFFVPSGNPLGGWTCERNPFSGDTDATDGASPTTALFAARDALAGLEVEAEVLS